MWDELLESEDEFFFFGSEFLLDAAGCSKDGKAVGGAHGVEKLDGGLAADHKVGFGNVEVIEKEADETLGELHGCGGRSFAGGWRWRAGRRDFFVRGGSFDGEAGNELGFAVVEKEEVVLCEIWDGFAIRVANHDANDNEVDVELERSGVLGGDFLGRFLRQGRRREKEKNYREKTAMGHGASRLRNSDCNRRLRIEAGL
jgi:hypothetical protein